MTKIAFFDGSYGYLTTADDDGTVNEIVTTRAHAGKYIRIDDGRQYPQLCAGGSFWGSTLEWAATDMGRHFARDCGARLYKTQNGYDRARLKLAAAEAA